MTRAQPDPDSYGTRVTMRVCRHCQEAIALDGEGVWQHCHLTGAVCADDDTERNERALRLLRRADDGRLR